MNSSPLSLFRNFVVFLLAALAIVLTVGAFTGEAQAEPVAAAPSGPTTDAGKPLPKADCTTPRRAVYSLLYWTDPGRVDLARAALCVERRGRSPVELGKRAKDLRVAYDSRAVIIDYTELSDAAGEVMAGQKVPNVTPSRAIGDFQLGLASDGRWLWTKGSLDHAEYLVQQSWIPASFVMSLPDWLRTDFFGVEGWQVLSLMLVVVLGLIVRRTIQFILRRRFAPLAARFGSAGVGNMVDAFAGPGSTLVMAGMLAAFYPQLGLPFTAALALGIAVRAMVVLSVVMTLYRLVDVLADRMAAKAEETDSKLDDQLVPLVRKALKIVVVVAGVLFLLQNLNVNVGSLLAGLGIGGVAVALAAKDTIANFFGSLMIFIDKPFQIGDWVKVGDVEGIVEEVGFRSTRVRTFYNSLVTIPNAHFTEAAIDNLGLREYRRTFTTLNLTYDTTPEQMQAFVEGIRAVIQANTFTRKDYYEIHFSGFGAHSLDVMVYMFFKVESWTEELRERHNVYIEILRLAKQLGVEFAFPTQTLHVDHLAQMGQARNVPAPQQPEELGNVVRAFGPDGELARPQSPYVAGGFVAGGSRRGGDGEG